jgi:hypothetical protein
MVDSQCNAAVSDLTGHLVGVVVAGWDALKSDWWGYAVTMLNNVLSASVMVTVRSVDPT